MEKYIIYLLIFLCLGLILINLTHVSREGMENMTNEYIGPAGDDVKEYDPNSNMNNNTSNNNSDSDVYIQNIPRENTTVYPPMAFPIDESTTNGIPKSQIPPGDEDLYILKSQVVPPVCPACPTVTKCPREKPCPPCAPCARCPEPAFECKKVPNYSSSNDSYLPKPVLTDFSQFGM